ncbi:MAG TPA: hypothetical protein VN040_25705 [Pseudosphingobacterium sp.]|nr:hypothetical protein [Pseudosphingobacterium sp.]
MPLKWIYETHTTSYAPCLTENRAIDYLKKATNNWTQARNFDEQLQLIIKQKHIQFDSGQARVSRMQKAVECDDVL